MSATLKKGPWTEQEDAFLLRYLGVGAGFISSHDLGRSEASGVARVKKLVGTGAAHEFAKAMMHLNRYRMMCGRVRAEFAADMTCDEIDYWDHRALEWQPTANEVSA